MKKAVTTQRDKFIEAARDIGTDDTEAAFDRVLRKVAKAPPAPMPKKIKAPKKAARGKSR